MRRAPFMVFLNVASFYSVFTARKRSLGQGNVFTPVCQFTGGLPTGVYLRRGSLPRGEFAPRGHLPGGSSSGVIYLRLRGLHLGGGRSAKGVCLQRGRVCLERGLPNGSLHSGRVCILGDGQTPRTRKAGSTHPTGPLSCSSCSCRQI